MGQGSRRKGRPAVRYPCAHLPWPGRLRVTRRETVAILRQALVPQVPLRPAASALPQAAYGLPCPTAWGCTIYGARAPLHPAASALSQTAHPRSRVALHHARGQAKAAGQIACVCAALAGRRVAAAHGQSGLLAAHRVACMLRPRARPQMGRSSALDRLHRRRARRADRLCWRCACWADRLRYLKRRARRA